MNKVDTTGIEPMSHAIPIVNVMREDKVVSEQTKEELMANANNAVQYAAEKNAGSTYFFS